MVFHQYYLNLLVQKHRVGFAIDAQKSQETLRHFTHSEAPSTIHHTPSPLSCESLSSQKIVNCFPPLFLLIGRLPRSCSPPLSVLVLCIVHYCLGWSDFYFLRNNNGCSSLVELLHCQAQASVHCSEAGPTHLRTDAPKERVETLIAVLCQAIYTLARREQSDSLS